MKDLSAEKSLATIEINNRLFFRFFQAANTLPRAPRRSRNSA